jgi:hypothetical protein
MRMTSKWTLAGAALALGAVAAAITFDVNHPLLNGHIEKLRQANSLTVVFSVNQLGKDLEDQKLILSKPSLMRYETPGSIVIANGATIATLDRKTNQYTEEPQTPEALKKLLAGEVLWTWSAFADETFLKPITDARTAASRRLKGSAVKEVNVSRGSKVITLFIDDQLNVARGSTFQTDAGGQKSTTIIIASEVLLGKDALTASDKSFAMPSGAQKVEKSALASTWKDVSPIFSANCGCHVGRATAGLSLGSHRGIMAGSRSGAVIVPGDPDASLLMQAVRGTRPPKMPPQGNLSPAQLDTLAKWIKDGAKE